MRVGIDLDGVCYDFGASVRKYLSGSFEPTEEHPEVTRWEFYEDWGMSLTNFLDLCDRGVDDYVIFRQGEPFPDTRLAFDKIRAAGHSIHIVTDRSFGTPGKSAVNTLEWLAFHGLKFDSITFSADKTIACVDTMIDDKPENVMALAGTKTRAFLQRRAWNDHLEWEPCVSSLLEYAEVICR